MNKSEIFGFVRSYVLFWVMILLLNFSFLLLGQFEFFQVALIMTLIVGSMGLASGIALLATFKNKHTQFMAALFGSLMVKIIILLLVLYVLVQNYANTLFIVVSFLIAYVLFTVFEVSQIIHKLRPHLKRSDASEKGK